jgi:RHS repeat-associated protein
VKIVENGGSSPGTKQFIWCGTDRCEVRDGSSNVTAQFFDYGETISGTSYYFTEDHLGSIREMTNSAGTIVWQQSFDPYGVPTTIVSTTPSDIGYAGYYVHSRSGLNLTATRAYSATLGRFISRDPIEEDGGVNLYSYVDNDPIINSDPLGLLPDYLGGKKCAKKLSCWLLGQAPKLNPKEASKIAADICKKIGPKEIWKGAKALGADPGQVLKDMFTYNNPFASDQARNDAADRLNNLIPSDLNNLTPEQVQLIKELLNSLPASDRAIIDKIEPLLPSAKPPASGTRV